jgi:ATP-dependent Clp protease ATP-binding subunit ClpB
VIQKRLIDPLALALLEGEYREGDTVTADALDGNIVLTAGAPAAAPAPAQAA